MKTPLKLRFRQWLLLLREGAAQLVVRHPVEMVLLAIVSVGVLCLHYAEGDTTRLGAVLTVTGWYALVMYGANRALAHTRWRRYYVLALVPLVLLLTLHPALAEWVVSQQYALLCGVLTPLALLIFPPVRTNERLVAVVQSYLSAVVVALFFSYTALGLFCAVVYSAAYIFDCTVGTWIVDVVSLVSVFVVPSVFMAVADRRLEERSEADSVLTVLVNYLFTPALVAYTAILYLYAAKILFAWSLPRGGVAWMVLLFALVMLCCRSLHETLPRRFAAPFYRRFSLVLLAPMLLFWAGTARRIGDYGLTEWRVWLVLCGILMTLAVVLYAARRTARLRWLCIAAFVLVGAVAFVPALHPKRLAEQSQEARGGAVAERDDTVEVVQAGPVLYLPENAAFRADPAYTRLYCVVSCYKGRDKAVDGVWIDRDGVLHLQLEGRRLLDIEVDALVRRQLEKAGVSYADCADSAPEQVLQLLDYADERVRIIFRLWRLEHDEAADRYGLGSCSVELVMTR